MTYHKCDKCKKEIQGLLYNRVSLGSHVSVDLCQSCFEWLALLFDITKEKLHG